MRISVVVPTLDEEEALPRTLEAVRRPGPGEVEVLVCDGGSSDKTVELAGRLADRVLAAGRGRAVQMQAGAEAARGEVLLFLHADTLLPEDWRSSLHEAWSSAERPSMTAFRLSFDRPGAWLALAAWSANLRTALTGVPHGDQAIAVSREAFLEAGGFPPEPLMEEYLLARRLRGRGRLRVLPAAVVTSARRYEANGPMRNTLRNLALLLLFRLGVPPRALARLYR